MQEQVISLRDITMALKTRWKLIVIITFFSTLISGVFSFFIIKPQYEVSTKLFVGKDSSENKGYDNNDVVMYQKLIKTYAEVIQTKDLVREGLRDENLKIEPEKVLGGLTVAPRADTQILEIKYKSTSPQEAMEVSKAITNVFIKKSSDLINNSNVQVLEAPIYPEKPISPNKALNIIIGFILGLMMSLGLVFLLEYLNNTYKSVEDVSRALGIPVIGAIPKET